MGFSRLPENPRASPGVPQTGEVPLGFPGIPQELQKLPRGLPRPVRYPTAGGKPPGGNAFLLPARAQTLNPKLKLMFQIVCVRLSNATQRFPRQRIPSPRSPPNLTP